jgi:hypothetical protein
MSTRERWIVYPLLFLTLGIVLRDKFVPQRSLRVVELEVENARCNRLELDRLEAGRIDCQFVKIAGPSGEDRVRMGVAGNDAGMLELCGRDGTRLLVAGADDSGRAGLLETFAGKGIPLVQVRSGDRGGQITTFQRDKKLWLVLAHEELGSGLFAVQPGPGLLSPLALYPRRPPPDTPAPD